MTTKDKNATPKISVIITCYNYGKFIDKAIQSVQNQTFLDWELIVIDDCSTDEFTKKRIKQLSEFSYPVNSTQFNLILLDKNVGVAKARNTAITEAKAKYIICLDADDKIEPTCLQKMYDIITTNKYDIVGCGYQEFGEGNESFIRQYSKFKICTENLLPVTALFKKFDWQKVGGFSEVECEDHMFWLQLTELDKRFFIIQEALLLYRKHAGTSRQNKVVNSLTLELRQKLEVQRIKENPALFNRFIQEQKRQMRILKKKRSKLILGFSLVILISVSLNILQTLF